MAVYDSSVDKMCYVVQQRQIYILCSAESQYCVTEMNNTGGVREREKGKHCTRIAMLIVKGMRLIILNRIAGQAFK